MKTQLGGPIASLPSHPISQSKSDQSRFKGRVERLHLLMGGVAENSQPIFNPWGWRMTLHFGPVVMVQKTPCVGFRFTTAWEEGSVTCLSWVDMELAGRPKAGGTKSCKRQNISILPSGGEKWQGERGLALKPIGLAIFFFSPFESEHS